MIQSRLFLSALFLGLAFSAQGSPLFKSGTYSCRLKEASEHFKSNAGYNLKFQGEQATLTRDDGKSLVGKRSGGSYLVQSGDLLPKRKHGEIMTSRETPDLKSLELIVSVREREGEYLNERFDCKAVEAPATAKPRLIQFDCRTEEAFDSKGRARIRFGVAVTDSPRSMELVTFEGKEDEVGMPVKVSPKSQVLEALNDNSSLTLDDGRFVLIGDFDGIFFVTLELYETTGFEHGFLRVEDKSGDVKSSYNHLSCKVGGEL